MTQLTQQRLAWQQQLLAMMGNWARPGFIPQNLINMAMTNANRIPASFPSQLSGMLGNPANLSTPPLSPTSFAQQQQQQQQQMLMSMMMMNGTMPMMSGNVSNLMNNDIHGDGQTPSHSTPSSKPLKP